MRQNIFAIIVTYKPNLNELSQILQVITRQCKIILADNGDDQELSEELSKIVEKYDQQYVSMNGNCGIGCAQNRAIKIAWCQGADAILLLDDDSIPAENIIEDLIRISEFAGKNAVVSAMGMDVNGKQIDFIFRKNKLLIQSSKMRSSGTLIRRTIFESVGYFDESLFIDCVDFDWGWRARKLGVVLYQTCGTFIIHKLGEGDFLGMRYGSPSRHYYQYRNILRMLFLRHTPWYWRFTQLIKLPIKIALILIFFPNKIKRLRFAFAGIRDFLRGRSGALTWSNDPNLESLGNDD
jgi:rhamnosyltransferase